ncbi:MAG: S24 family peptidase, partial [Planctomycetota bacterium]
MQRLGQVVRERRRSLGLTLADVAERSGVTRGYVSMIENHKVDNPPSEKVLAKLGAALKFAAGELERAAQWERTPEAIRQRLAQAEDGAKAGRELAQWLRQVSAKRERGTGKDLDALYRSGQLGRRVNAVLAEGEGARIEDRGSSGGATDAVGGAGENSRRVTRGGDAVAETHGVDARGARGKAVGLGGAASSCAGVPGLSIFVDSASDIGHRTSEIAHRPAVPLINKVAAGLPSGFTDLDYPARTGDELVVVPGYTGLHGANDPDAFAATVSGESMQPGYHEGDVVVFSPLADVVDGCDCFVRLEPDHETTFKRVFLDEEAGRIRLQPLNPAFEPRTVDREQVAGMYRAVWR